MIIKSVVILTTFVACHVLVYGIPLKWVPKSPLITNNAWVRGALVCGRVTVVRKNNTGLAKKVQLKLLVILS